MSEQTGHDAPRVSSTFTYPVRMRLTDGAGVVFFARWFEIAHDAYEDFLTERGAPLPSDLAHAQPILPLVHAEADYLASIALGDRIRVRVEVAEVRRTAFTLAYTITKEDGALCGRLRTVHVAVDRIGGRAVELPSDVRAALGG
jgi:1,4-dihydroxy-2-naphthoyl-CoA hydrolase